MYIVRLLPLVFLVSTQTSSSPKEQTIRFLRNFNTFLTSPSEFDRNDSVNAIFDMFAKTPYDWALIATSMKCLEKGNCERRALPDWVTEHLSPEAIAQWYGNCQSTIQTNRTGEKSREGFPNSDFMKRFVDWNVTSVQNYEDKYETSKEDGKTIESTKWAFNKNEGKMICNVSLQFAETVHFNTEYQLEKVIVDCPDCAF